MVQRQKQHERGQFSCGGLLYCINNISNLMMQVFYFNQINKVNQNIQQKSRTFYKAHSLFGDCKWHFLGKIVLHVIRWMKFFIVVIITFFCFFFCFVAYTPYEIFEYVKVSKSQKFSFEPKTNKNVFVFLLQPLKWVKYITLGQIKK